MSETPGEPPHPMTQQSAEPRFEDGAATHPVAPASSSVATAERRETGWTENRPSSGWFPRFDASELWSYREVALVLAVRNVKLRYKQTLLGVVWAILQPLAGVAIFTLLFGRLADIPSDGIPYPVFVYAGLSVWLYFANSANTAAESLAQYRELVTKVYFPRLLAPLAAVMPSLIDLAVSLMAVGVFMALFDVAPSVALVLLPVWILAAVATAFGAGVWLSALNVQYRDVRNMLAFLLQLWFFATPVVYASSLVDGNWRFLLAVNPMAGLLDGFRWSLIGAPAPGGSALVSLAVGAVMLVSGVVYFGRVERRFADLI
jgi:lipopolysaccharide transport system permease protein